VDHRDTPVRAAFDQVNLVAEDMGATVAFYNKLGLEIPDRAVWQTGTGAHHISVPTTSGVTIEFDSLALAQEYNSSWRSPSGPQSRVVLGFSLPSREAVDDLHAELSEAGHRTAQPPFDAFWGARYAIVEDPDGNQVGIMSPVDPERASSPPSI
jgi:predicted lactoylglutathione lyase